jgi:ribosomal protein L11 methyltransferase
MNYYKVSFELEPLLPAREILYADLDQLDFESIVDTKTGVEAFIPESDFNRVLLDDLMIHNLPDLDIKMEVELIEQQNWNANWESQFEPIVVNEKCIIRAPFHDKSSCEYDIVISPKMSFGTGHHETTFLLSQHLFEMDLKGKSVMDMGCGTGVLAIIAKKLGAATTQGIDIENWAYLNSIENANLNQIDDIEFFEGDASLLGNESFFDVFIANINRNILHRDIPLYFKTMKRGAILLISGFYTTDVEVLTTRALEYGLKFVNSKSKNNWAMVQFIKD